MTDSRITVDVSAEVLVQRAREQQAQSRQAVIQQEEEKREKARQQREAQKAGRGSVPGQSKLQGRSRPPQTGSKRREVAAGLAQTPYKLATCFMQEIAFESLGPSGVTDRSYPYKVLAKIWSYDQQATATYDSGFAQEYYEDVPRFSVSVTETYQPLPINAGSFILWCQKLITGQTIPDGQVVTNNQCFLITQRSVRKIGTPVSMAQLNARIFFGEVNGISTNNGRSGTPRTIQGFLGIEQSAPPRFLKLNQEITRNDAFQIVDIARTMTGTVHRQSDYLDTGKPASWLSKKARVDNEEIVTDKATNFEGTIDPADFPLLGSFPVMTWDWGNPALCRRLLLQLGFTPADLVP